MPLSPDFEPIHRDPVLRRWDEREALLKKLMMLGVLALTVGVMVGIFIPWEYFLHPPNKPPILP